MTNTQEGDLYLPIRNYVSARRVDVESLGQTAAWLERNDHPVTHQRTEGQSGKATITFQTGPDKWTSETRTVDAGNWIVIGANKEIIAILNDDEFTSRYRKPFPGEGDDITLGGQG
ncbi:hypothetical protein [Rhodococcus sp. IEGM 1307]|uniref:hypothetical protein n=1 Tax=Rhodococcus sp. IEGM 1307 TaxID=3047091 RepID=UPI0024B72C18|nr:hypothetical protein [Rhodococcus sp. IEGM 1307]MDI9973362.1 hypothetical protein [Rhodococcus sp. IEGM 1307]